jgi:hypothetical protein
MPINQVAPIGHPVLDSFLLGVICTSSFVAALFFLRFWKLTRDSLFLAFTAFFAIEGANEAYLATLPRPNVGTFAVTLIRLLTVLGVIGAIIRKNTAEH